MRWRDIKWLASDFAVLNFLRHWQHEKATSSRRGRGPLSICSCARTLKGYKAKNGALDKYHKNFLAVVERLAAGKFVAWGDCVVD